MNGLRAILLISFCQLFVVVARATAQSHLPGRIDYPAITYGRSVTGLGDLNGDGIPDFAVGAPEQTPGLVVVYSGIDRSEMAVITPPSNHYRFGWQVGNLGDINGDGKNELVVTTPRRWTTCSLVQPTPASEYTGYLSVYSGASIASGTPTVLYTLTGGVNRFFGYALAISDDLDGDGVKDMVVGVPYAAKQFGQPCDQSSGSIFLYSGQNGALIRSHTNGAFNTVFGSAVGSVGDVDGDGSPDYAAGFANGGYTILYSGQSGTQLNLFNSISGSIAGLGDIDGDQRDDFAIGSSTHNNDTGAVYFYSGATLSTLATLTGNAQGDQFGTTIANVGDSDGDSVSDVAISSRITGVLPPTNRLDVFSGATRARLVRYHNVSAFGIPLLAVATLGNYDSDQIPDFIVGSYLDEWGGSLTQPSGAAYIVSSVPSQSCTYRIVGNSVLCF